MIFEPLWQGDVVDPRFGGSLGDGSGAPIADGAATDGHDAGTSADGAGTVVADAAPVDAQISDAAASDAQPVDAPAPPDATGDSAGADATLPDATPPDASKPDAAVADTADASTPPDAGGQDVDATPPKPGFPALWGNVFTLYGCASPACHGASTEWPIFVDMQSSYATLLSNPATGPCKPTKYVVKGQPDASLLLRKIDPSLSSCGDKMPGAAGIAAEDAQAVRDWIAAGAPF